MAKLNSRHILEIYLSGDGRIGRGEFWGYWIALTFVLALLALGCHFVPSPFGEVLTVVLGLLMLWGYAVLMIKRGHDRGRPAWFSTLILLLRLAAEAANEKLGHTPPLVMAHVALVLYVLIDYALMPGTGGTNRYGPPIGGVNKNPLVLGGEATSEPALSSEASKA